MEWNGIKVIEKWSTKKIRAILGTNQENMRATIKGHKNQKGRSDSKIREKNTTK